MNAEKVSRYQVKCFKMVKAWARTNIKLEVAVVPQLQSFFVAPVLPTRDFHTGRTISSGASTERRFGAHTPGVFGLDHAHDVFCWFLFSMMKSSGCSCRGERRQRL